MGWGSKGRREAKVETVRRETCACVGRSVRNPYSFQNQRANYYNLRNAAYKKSIKHRLKVEQKSVIF